MREFSNTTAVPIRLVSGAAVVFFAPGQTRPLPDALVEAALDAGLVEVAAAANAAASAASAADALTEPAAGDDAAQSEASPPLSATIEFDKFALWRAFDAIAADGDKRLFNKDGTPKLREVKRLYGQPGLTRDIVDTEWRQYRGASE